MALDRQQVMDLPGKQNPVLCADGMLGMLLLYPNKPGDACGIQVHGEEQHRWIQPFELTASAGGALRQDGAPAMPPASFQADMVQLMLAIDWALRGGPLMASSPKAEAAQHG